MVCSIRSTGFLSGSGRPLLRCPVRRARPAARRWTTGRARRRAASRVRGLGRCRRGDGVAALPEQRPMPSGVRARGGRGTTHAPRARRRGRVRAAPPRAGHARAASRTAQRLGLGDRLGRGARLERGQSAGVDTAQSGCAAASRSIRSGSAEHVPGAQPGEAPGLGQAADDDERRAGRRPARDSGSPGTQSMNASSTTTIRPGRASAATASAGCSTEVGLVGLPITTRSASAGTAAGSRVKSLVEDHPVHRVPGGPQGGLRLGELRVHDDRPARARAPARAGRTPRRRPR